MSDFGAVSGSEPNVPGYNPDNLDGFEVEPLPPDHRDDPGRVLGIVGFVLAIFLNIVGMIVCIIAYNRSRKAGFSNGWAVAGIVIAVFELLFGAVLTTLFVAGGFAMYSAGS